MIRRLAITLLCLLLLTGSAQASPLGDLTDALSSWCYGGIPLPSVLGDAEARLDFICTAARISGRLESIGGDIGQTAQNLLQDAINFGLGKAVGAFQTYLGDDLNAALSDIEAAINAGEMNFRLAMAQLFTHKATNRLEAIFSGPDLLDNATIASDDPTTLSNYAIRTNPGLLQQELATARQEFMLGQVLGESADIAAKTDARVEGLTTRDEENALVLRVTNPAGTGTADQVDQIADETVSTRAAVQLMLEAQTSVMRQQAVEQTAVVTAVKEMTLQQAYTTQQLSTLVEQTVQERLDKVADWRGELEQEMHQLALEANKQASMLYLTADFMRTIDFTGTEP